MFFAINKTTNEKVNSLTVQMNPSYQCIEEDMWYADPDEIDCCPPNLNINKIEVLFRRGTKEIINFNGTTYSISPHFFIPNKEELGINTIPESIEHRMAKDWIYNKIIQNNLIINYSSVNKPYKYKNQINLFDLPIDFKRIGIEVSSSTFGNKTSRRADVICPFLIKDNILGKGIVFEIQFSKQRENTKHYRELDWAIRGYSVAWLYSDDFNFLKDRFIELKKNEVDTESNANLLKINNKEFIKNLRYEVMEQCRLLDQKKKQIEEDIKEYFGNCVTAQGISINEIIQDSLKDFKKNLQPICPKCKIPMVLKKGKNGGFWGCINYPNCRSTSDYKT